MKHLFRIQYNYNEVFDDYDEELDEIVEKCVTLTDEEEFFGSVIDALDRCMKLEDEGCFNVLVTPDSLFEVTK